MAAGVATPGSDFAFGALRTGFYGAEIRRRRRRDDEGIVTLAVRMPFAFANGTEDEAASRARDRLRRRRPNGLATNALFDAANVTNGLASDGRTPEKN